MNPWAQLDIRRALADFDGNEQDVAEVLALFLQELPPLLAMLEEGPVRGRRPFAVLLHEVANSLQSAWCFAGGERVRMLEQECRRGEAPDLAALQHEAHAIVIDAAERARAWLREPGRSRAGKG